MNAPTEAMIRRGQQVSTAQDILRHVSYGFYPQNDIEIRAKEELVQIRRKLDAIVFALEYPEQARKNKTLEQYDIP